MGSQVQEDGGEMTHLIEGQRPVAAPLALVARGRFHAVRRLAGREGRGADPLGGPPGLRGGAGGQGRV